MLLVDDICPRAACLALDQGGGVDFGGSGADSLASLDAKREIAVNDWLSSTLLANGHQPLQHRLRRAPDAVWRLTDAGAWTNHTEAAGDLGKPVDLATVLDATSTGLLVGMLEPFTALEIVVEKPTTATVTLVAAYWTGQWTALPAGWADGTKTDSAHSFEHSGRVTWPRLAEWIDRRLGDSGDTRWFFVLRLSLSNTHTSPIEIQSLFPIRPSRLTIPAAYYALALVYNEADTVSRGEWKEKAQAFFGRADDMLQRALPRIADEFDIDQSGAITRTERDIGGRSVRTIVRG